MTAFDSKKLTAAQELTIRAYVEWRHKESKSKRGSLLMVGISCVASALVWPALSQRIWWPLLVVPALCILLLLVQMMLYHHHSKQCQKAMTTAGVPADLVLAMSKISTQQIDKVMSN